MPLIANSIVVTSAQGDENPPSATSEKPAMRKRYRLDSEHHLVEVDGKARKLSKHSAYFFDMLTLDIE